MELAKKIIEARKQAGLTQVAVANKLGISSRAYQKYESGVSKPADIHLLEKVLGVPLGTLDETDLSPAEQLEYIKTKANALLADGQLNEVDFDVFIREMIEINEDAKKRKSEAALRELHSKE